jgi:hypothetical protein
MSPARPVEDKKIYLFAGFLHTFKNNLNGIEFLQAVEVQMSVS